MTKWVNFSRMKATEIKSICNKITKFNLFICLGNCIQLLQNQQKWKSLNIIGIGQVFSQTKPVTDT